ncbi:MAG: hypothetical protein QXZ68_02110 [Candidatus Bathyarchaeia archaeon]
MNRKAITFFACLSLLLALTNTAKTQTSNMETFFDSKISCVKVQVNATSKTQPASFISVELSLTAVVTKVYVKTIDLTIYGFINGTEKHEIYHNVSGNVTIFKDGRVVYSHQVYLPENVCGVIYGEVYLEYDATVVDELGRENPYPFQGTIGFATTRVENVCLKSLEEQLRDVYNTIDELNQTFRDCFGRNLTRDELLNLNETLWQLRRDYETLKGVKSELDDTRTAMVFLAVVAVFFVATTAYLVFRKPKSYW